MLIYNNILSNAVLPCIYVHDYYFKQGRIVLTDLKTFVCIKTALKVKTIQEFHLQYWEEPDEKSKHDTKTDRQALLL